jgi:hypothetical protein
MDDDSMDRLVIEPYGEKAPADRQTDRRSFKMAFITLGGILRRNSKDVRNLFIILFQKHKK